MLSHFGRSTLRTASMQRCNVMLYTGSRRQYSSAEGTGDGKVPSSDSRTNTTPGITSNTGAQKTFDDNAQLNRMESLLDSLGRSSSQRSTSGPAKNSTYKSLLSDRGAAHNIPFLRNKTGRYGGYGSEESVDQSVDAILHVHASSNNTIVSLTDANGRVFFNSSGGQVGFRKAQRSGFEAAYQATASIANKARDKDIRIRSLEIRLRGFGTGRDAAFKAVTTLTSWPISAVTDVTPIPFNGCRPKKARRL